MPDESIDLARFSWLNPPKEANLAPDCLEFTTSPDTDFWQRTHYGFRSNTGHAFLTALPGDFSFSAQAEFVYENLFDQCGLLLYIDEDNWAKASLEFEEGLSGQLGSVVTNGGWSDWASTPMDPIAKRIFYRVSRRAADFMFECSLDGNLYHQMRVFHMTGDLARLRVGVYACSPQESSFKVKFTGFAAGESKMTD